MNKCKELIEYINNGLSDYVTCNKNAKYKISYKEGATGKIIEKCVCGIHYQSIKKWSERVLKRTEWDAKFTYNKI